MPKKGLELLLDALGKIPSDRPWSWTHIGGGPESARLRRIASTHPYKERLRFVGPLPHTETMQTLAQSDIFVLTAVVAGNGDRDGRPNAIIEAMQLGLACVATRIGGIPEIAKNEEDALLIEPSADDAARALTRLLHDDDLRARLGRAAKARSIMLAQEGEIGLESLTHALREASGQT
jgi:glycosyltransferase involved in cell wall biosynthesis